jgi:hypothetical protein
LPATYGLPYVGKHKRLTPKERQGFADQVVKAYEQGASIRAVMRESGRSYGHIHRILAADPSVRMRTRGGANHHPVSRKTPQG